MIKFKLLLAVSWALKLHLTSIYVSSYYMPRNELHPLDNFYRTWLFQITYLINELLKEGLGMWVWVGGWWCIGKEVLLKQYSFHYFTHFSESLGTYWISCPFLTDVTTATCQIWTWFEGEFQEEGFINPNGCQHAGVCVCVWGGGGGGGGTGVLENDTILLAFQRNLL